MRLSVLVAVAAVAAFALACASGDGGPRPGTPSSQNGSTVVPVTPGARPASVPQAARAIEQTTTLGRIERRAGQPPLAVMTRRVVDAACEGDVVSIGTSQERIFASLVCDRFWDERSAALFLDQEAAIVLEATDVRFRILIETLGGAQSEFTVAGIWVE